MKRLFGSGAILFILLVLALSGCGGNSGVPTTPETSVYIGGYFWDEAQLKYVPCYWKGTARTELSGVSDDSALTSIYVAGSTVYAAGHYYNGTKTVACYWGAGGTRTDISDVPSTATSVYTASIYVDGSTIYVAGYYGNGVTNTPCYWVNGSRQDLTIPIAPPDVTDAWAKAIYVSNGTVYIAGTATTGAKDYPCYWTGSHPVTGTGTVLSNTNGGGAESICVSNTGTVYIAGCDRDGSNNNIPCYWQGSNRQPLTLLGGETSAIARYIHVSENGTVYTAGYGNSPCYWVGTTPTKLGIPDGGTDGSVESGFVTKDGTVYTAGAYHNGSKFIACYWKGTSRTDLSPEANEGYGNSIFVVE